MITNIIMIKISKRNSSRNSAMCDINVTPFVDVMLVLLVVFMVTSPMLVSNIDVNLPKYGNSETTVVKEPIIVSINSSGEFYIKDMMVDIKGLVKQIDFWSYGNKEANIQLYGDKEINYGKVMEAIAAISGAGYNKVFLVTAKESS